MNTTDKNLTKGLKELHTLLDMWEEEHNMKPLEAAAILMATASRIYQYHLNDDEFDAMMDNVKDAKLGRDTDEEEVSGTIH